MPKQLVWDNEGGVGKFRGRGRPPVLSAQFAKFRGLLGCEIVVLPPREPEHKGIVERNNDYLETSFLPGRVFASPADFNAQLAGWTGLANSRFKRVLGCAPADRIEADRAAMAPLPPLRESSLGWHNRIRLPRDHYVRVDTCDYSVDPAVIGRMVEVRADLECDRSKRQERGNRKPVRSVAQLPELLSASYRNRVRKLSPRNQNHGVKHEPESHTRKLAPRWTHHGPTEWQKERPEA